MDSYVADIVAFAIAWKWWLIAIIPIALAVVVVKTLNPN